MRRLGSALWSLAAMRHRCMSSTTVLSNSKSTPSDPLNDFFCELEEVETSSGLQKKASNAGSSHSKMRPSAEQGKPVLVPTKGETSTAVPSMSAAMATKAALQRALKEAKEEERELSKESEREQRAKQMEQYRPAPPARTFLTSGEMIADKAPQHFSIAPEVPRGVREVTDVGSAAVVSLVGKVIQCGGITESGATAENAFGEDGELTYEIAVEYTVPFLAKPRCSVLPVHCVGVTLATFAREHVKVGDIVHVLGHLVPVTEAGESLCHICALPFGGNISVVARFTE